MSEAWQECASMHHVGDDHDPTVEWRDLGLLCEACYSALVDRRAIAVTDEMAERAGRVLWEDDMKEQDYSWEPNKALYLDLARRVLSAALGEIEPQQGGSNA